MTDLNKEETKAWERQRDKEGGLEPNLWYDRFDRFRLMGPDRSLLGLYKLKREEKGRKGKVRKAPTAWLKAAKKWRWRERAEAWDEAEREREQKEYEAERLEWRERRRRLLQGFFTKLAQALDKFEPEDASLGSLTQATKAAVQELRTEFDDEPAAKHDVTVGLDESTRQLLAPFFALIARYIPADKMEEFKAEMKEIAGGENG